MARVLVTGGAGFIGSNLVGALVGRGDEVVVLDDLSTGRRENLDGLGGAVRLVVGSICDEPTVRDALRGVTHVSHQAARPSVQRSLESPAETHRVNVDGTLTVLRVAKELGVRRVVCASSSSVYGNAPELPKHEGLLPRPASPYAASKLAGEGYAQAFHASFGLETVSLRYFNVFGPRQDPKSAYAAVIPRFVTAALRGERAVVYGSGEQTRDFTFVGNVVDANLRALGAEGVGGRVFNIAAGARTSLLALLGAIGELVGAPVSAEHLGGRAGEVLHSQAEIRAARDALGYAPSVGLREGLARTIEWYRAALG